MFSDLWHHAGVGGFAYLVVAMQVRMGFPPLYRPFISNDEEEIERIVKLIFLHFFAMITVMTLSLFTDWPGLMTILGGIAVWAGLRLRQDLVARIGAPMSCLQNTWTLRWPMLPFDAWTLALTLGFVALTAG